MNAVDLLELCWSGEMASMGLGDGLACGPQGPLGVCIMCSGEHHAYLAWCVHSHPDFEVFSAKRHFEGNVVGWPHDLNVALYRQNILESTLYQSYCEHWKC